MISVQNVWKTFGKQTVLAGLNLEIEDGKVTTIVGPSGVGKSVLLKLIMGVYPVDSGVIFVEGSDVTKAVTEADKNLIRENLGVLFQSAALLDSINIYENVAFPLVERALCKSSEVKDRVIEILDSLSLLPYASKLPQEVPIGIRKRTGMARALITKPKVVLVDEPNTGLDPLVGQEVYDLIKECREKWKFTGVVISHELPEVFQVSDQVAMIYGGKIILKGTPAEFANSSDPIVKQFLNGETEGPIHI